MFNLKFTAPVGNDLIKVDVSLPSGMDGDTFVVMIDGYYYGSIVKCNNQWTRLHVNKLELTVDDVQALGERIDEELKR